MIYRPPFPTPFATDGALPPSVSASVDASPAWWADHGKSADEAAGRVIDANAGRIKQFVQQQRAGYSAGIIANHKSSVSLAANLDVIYQNQQGREMLHYRVRPESAVSEREVEIHEVEIPEIEIPVGLENISTLAVVFHDGAT